MSPEPALVGVDWGTTQMRILLLGRRGEILDQRSSEQGIGRVPQEQLADAFWSAMGDWQSRFPDLPIAMSGMVGSRQGWRELPYLPCPLTPDALSQGLLALEPEASRGRRIFLVPGVCGHAMGPDGQPGQPEVMRGEETQIAGAIGQGFSQGWLCLPGTHSKWARIEAGVLLHFRTFMTGELFALLCLEGMLAKGIQSQTQAEDPEAFRLGLQVAHSEGGLLHQLFGVRSRSLLGGLPGRGQRDYLSGLLLGSELAAMEPLLSPHDAIGLVGSQSLSPRYAQALAPRQPQTFSGLQTFAKGLVQIVEDAGQLRRAP